jgi:MFS family permease
VKLRDLTRDRRASHRSVGRQRQQLSLLLAGQTLSATGDWLLLIALPFYIYSVTHSSIATGLIYAAKFVPAIGLGPLGGVIADRWDRRRLMIICDVLRATLLTLLVLPAAPERIWTIYLVVILQSALTTCFTSAKSALICQIVERHHLDRVNGLLFSADVASRIIGPAVGGFILATAGLALAAAVDALSYVVSAVTLVRINADDSRVQPDSSSQMGALDQPKRQSRGFFFDLQGGAQYIVANKQLYALTMVLGPTTFALGIVTVVMPAYVKDVMGAPASTFGLLMAAEAGAGMILAPLGHRLRRRIPQRSIIACSIAIIGLSQIGLASTASFSTAFIFMALIGGPGALVSIVVQTAMQQACCDELRGRVAGNIEGVVTCTTMLGLLVGSTVGDKLSVPISMALSGITLTAIGLLFLNSHALPDCRERDSRQQPEGRIVLDATPQFGF